MEPDESIIDGLRRVGLIGPGRPAFEPLAGGVSCDVWKVETLAGPAVVKRPLAKLRVEADWRAPVERGESEVRWLRRAREVVPTMVPEVLAELPGEHGFVLRFLPDCPVWKDELIAGRVDVGFANSVGKRIAAVHAATANSPTEAAAFPTDAMFRALRVDPFILHVAEKDAVVAEPLRAIAGNLVQRKTALVHGDVSPKNILVGADGPVFLDAECAVYGDPAFDLAFCTTHLLLKAVWLDDARLRVAAGELVEGYCAGIDWEPPEALLMRAGRLTAALLLARVDGKSPAPYLTDPADREIVRQRARALLLDALPLGALVSTWKGKEG